MNAQQVLDIIYEKYLNNEISKDELLTHVKLIETIEQMFKSKKTNGYYNQNMSVRPDRQKQLFRSAER